MPVTACATVLKIYRTWVSSLPKNGWLVFCCILHAHSLDLASTSYRQLLIQHHINSNAMTVSEALQGAVPTSCQSSQSLLDETWYQLSKLATHCPNCLITHKLYKPLIFNVCQRTSVQLHHSHFSFASIASAPHRIQMQIFSARYLAGFKKQDWCV